MSRNSTHNSIIDISDDTLRELLLLGNVFDNNKRTHLLNIIQQIEIGNKKLYKQFVTTIFDLMKQNPTQKPIKQLMYDHITELAITANPVLINDLNNDVFALLPTVYKQNEALNNYVSLWKHMYNGKKDKEDFPNIAKTLEKIPTQPSVQITGKLSKYYSEFSKNFQRAKEKKVEFFEDFEDSQLSQSFADQSRITQIVYMDIMELKAIRQKVETQPMTEQNCTEYLIKMKTFLNLRPNSLSGEMLMEFNKEKVWAKHFIDHHHEYLKRGNNNNGSRQSGNLTNPLVISLSKDEQSIDQPVQRFSKNNYKPMLTPSSSKQQTFGYLEPNSNKKLQSEIKNFTINEVPIDESRFIEHPYKNVLPAFNNSLNDGYGFDGINEKSLGVVKNERAPDVSNNFYQKMSFQPAGNLHNAVKPMPISRPSPQETLPLEESTLNNMSIPMQANTPVMKPSLYQQVTAQQFPKKGNGQNIDFGSYSKNSFTASNNPFANSKTNYNPQSNTKTPYDYYKSQQGIHQQSPIRNRMTEDDLDSDNIDQPIVIKQHYQKASYNYQDMNRTPGHSHTQHNFHSYNQQSPIFNLASHQKVMSQQLSPRSRLFTESKNSKKRLSELTSEKKQRKVNAPKQDNLNMPEEYAFKPYSVHFKKNSDNFNNFKRNCLEEKFPVYVSSELVISCQLRKLKDSKLQVELTYQNQSIRDMRMNVLYKIPKSFKIEKVSKIHKKFTLKNIETHVFNLLVIEFPLEMCLLDLSYSIDGEQVISNLFIHLPITIKNFIETLATSRAEWTKTFTKLTTQNQQEPYVIEKTFQLNRQVVDPSELERVLSREFINIGASEGYSVEEYGCVCFYRDINNLIFLVRISIRIDHIATVSIITEHQTTDNERDFMKYYLEMIVSLLAKYPI